MCDEAGEMPVRALLAALEMLLTATARIVVRQAADPMRALDELRNEALHNAFAMDGPKAQATLQALEEMLADVEGAAL